MAKHSPAKQQYNNQSGLNTMAGIVKPSDRPKLLLEFYWAAGGEDAFVCGAHGQIHSGVIEEIESEIRDNPEWRDDLFDKGAGTYLFDATWESEQTDAMGRVEVAGYWDLQFVGFIPSQLDQ